MMNQRIQELAEQCYENDQSLTGVGQRIFNKEKFAELLIRECMRVINGDIEYQANKGIITNFGGLNQARFLISHHFEVELTSESVPLRS